MGVASGSFISASQQTLLDVNTKRFFIPPKRLRLRFLRLLKQLLPLHCIVSGMGIRHRSNQLFDAFNNDCKRKCVSAARLSARRNYLLQTSDDAKRVAKDTFEEKAPLFVKAMRNLTNSSSTTSADEDGHVAAESNASF